MTGKIASKYADLYTADWLPAYYDEYVYGQDTFDSYVWTLQQPYLIRIFQALARKQGRLMYLNFACGTGRIIAALEHLATASVGLDLSPHMLALARSKVAHSTLTCGDILADPGVVDRDYDVITAFRFFLNTEPEMRRLIMHALAARLASRDSRLIFNVHGNRWSWMSVQALYRRLKGEKLVHTMSYAGVRRLVEDAGLEIDTWYGFGLWPHRLYRSRLAPLLKRIDCWAACCRPLRWISHDLLFVCRPQSG